MTLTLDAGSTAGFQALCWGLGPRVQGAGLGIIDGLGFRDSCLGIRDWVWGSGFRDSGSGFRD